MTWLRTHSDFVLFAALLFGPALLGIPLGTLAAVLVGGF